MYNYTPRTSNSLLLLLGLLLVFLYLSFVLCGQLRGSPLGGNSLLHIIPRVLQQKMRQNASVLPHYSLLSNSCMLLPLYWTSSFFPNSSSFFLLPILPFLSFSCRGNHSVVQKSRSDSCISCFQQWHIVCFKAKSNQAVSPALQHHW